MKEPCNRMGLASQDFMVSVCSACNTHSWKMDKNSPLPFFFSQAKWNFSVLILPLFLVSWLASGGVDYQRDLEAGGQSGALLETSAVQSSCKIPSAGKPSAGWSCAEDGLCTEGRRWKDGREMCWLFSQQHPLSTSFLMVLGKFACASLSHPILRSLKEEARNWLSLYLPFHLHKQPPRSSIWRHALDEARLIAQKLCLSSSLVNIFFPVG